MRGCHVRIVCFSRLISGMHRRSKKLVFLLVFAIAASGCASTPPVPPPPAAPPLPTTATAGAGTVVNVSPPAETCCPHPTLWEFLGVKGLAQGIGGLFNRVRNRLGSRFPGLEAKPPLLAITDPANMAADAPPAVKAAAEAKAFEDQAAQKVKALRYLAKLGCTDCFPDIEKAILAALDDCTEVVRYEAVLAVRTLAGGPCAVCKANSCCSPAITKRLERLANEMDSQGCYVEPSARVRRAARLAVAACGGPAVVTSDLPTEGPDAAPPEGPLPEELPGGPPAAAIRQPAAIETARQPQTLIPAQPTPARYCPRCRTAHADHEMHLEDRVTPVDFQMVIQEAQQEASTVVAEVNGEPIYERDVIASLERRGERERSIATMRAELIKCIDNKLICQDARALRGGIAQTSHGQPPASGIAEEELLAAQHLASYVQVSPVVDRQEIFNHYRARLDHYQPPAEVRWERMSAAIDRFGSKQNAEAAIIYLRDRAQGIASPQPKGLDLMRVTTESHSWTRKDQAATADLNHWLFVLPVGTVSPILYDEHQVYVVRVIERRQGRAATLEQATPHIEREILANRRAIAERDYLVHLRRRANVWTIFDLAATSSASSQP